jgi:hypothetical protein
MHEFMKVDEVTFCKTPTFKTKKEMGRQYYCGSLLLFMKQDKVRNLGFLSAVVLYISFFCNVILFGLLAVDVSARHTHHLRSF